MDPVAFNILLQSDYPDLIQSCRSSSRFFKICQLPYFWQEKARVDFGISKEAFSAVPGRDNKAAYEYLMKIDPNQGLVDAARVGSLALVNYFLSRDARDYNWAMAEAARNGHQEIVNQMIQRGADNYNLAMASAARNGHQEIVNQMLQLGDNDYNMAMALAAGGGHRERK